MYWSGISLTEQQQANAPKQIAIHLPAGVSRPPGLMGRLGGPWVVSEDVRNELERLEPSVNEFLPLTAVSSKDRRLLGQYFLVILRQKVDALVYDKTHFRKGTGLDNAKGSRFSLWRSWGPQYPITLARSKIEGKHLWRGTDDTRSSNYFCSDALANFIRENDINGWDLLSCEVED